jgi:hypothetical protein
MKLLEEFDKDGDGRLGKDERQAARDEVRKKRQEGGRRFGPRGLGRRWNAEPPRQGPKVSPGDVESYAGVPLYHPGVLRTLFIDFEDQDWEKEMADFYRTNVDIPATLKVDGREYTGVGIHFRGSSSFFTVGEGWKRSLNLALDHTDPRQRLYGKKTLELLNSHSDPTFSRSYLYGYIARNYLPAPEVNFVKVVLQGESWGIYVNSEQFNKDFLAEWFGTKKGARWKMPANPRGGKGLGYLGESLDEYKKYYNLKTKGAEKSWPDLIKLCKVLTETPREKLEEALPPILNVDRALWFLALDNVLINDDGYWIRASDFNLYQDKHGRFHVLPHDANETFRRPGGPGFGRSEDVPGVELDPLFGADEPAKPLLSRLLAVPAWRARYLAHVRTIVAEWLDWGKLGPIVERIQGLIGPEVKADTRKLDSFDLFTRAVADDYQEESSRGTATGWSLKRFVGERRQYLLGHREIKKPAPRVASLSRQVLRDGVAVAADPAPRESALITAEMAGEPRPDRVLLHYAAGKEMPFHEFEMKKLEDGRYQGAIPPLPGGSKVHYYVEARSSALGTTSFLPAGTELAALTYRVAKE